MIEVSPRERFLNKPPEVLIGGQGVWVSKHSVIHPAVREFGTKVGGAVSLTGIGNIFAAQLRNGEYDQINPAIAAFPSKDFAERVKSNFGAGGKYKWPLKPEKLVTGTKDEIRDLNELLILAAFVEVYRAKNGLNGDDPAEGYVGGNLLDKVNLGHLPLTLGGLVANIDYFVAGAGIPSWIPEVLDDYLAGKEATFWLPMQGYNEAGKNNRYPLKLDPAAYLPTEILTQLGRPAVLAIFSATSLVKRYADIFDGFVLEGRLAGGHIGPEGRNGIVFEEVRATGKPFYPAGSWSYRLAEAKEHGATGIQFGSISAITQESGYYQADKLRIVAGVHDQTLQVITSENASPTGYEFQEVVFGDKNDTLSNPEVHLRRIRNCSEGYLVTMRVNSKGEIVAFCSAEPELDYAKKLELIRQDMCQEEKEAVLAKVKADLAPTQCLCNGLESSAGHPTNGIMRNEDGKVVRVPEPRLLTWGRSAVVDPEAREQILRLTPDPTRLPTIIEATADALSH